MHTKKIFLLLTATLLLLSGCNKDDQTSTPGPGASTSGPTTSTTIEGGDVDYDDELFAGWPGEAITAYLSSVGNNETVPALPNVSESYVSLIADDPNFPDPYLEIYVPGAERTNEYKGILEAAGYDLELYVDEEYEDDYDYYWGYNATETIDIEFGYFVDEEYDEAGMLVYITGYESGSNPGGTGETPENPENAYAFSFANKAQLTTETATKGVWTNDGATVMIEKGESGHDVGNGSYWSNPLRVYALQKVTFTVPTGQTIDQVVVVTNDGKTVDGLENGTFAPNATVTSASVNVTIKPNSSVASISVVVSEQVRFESLTIYYK